VTAQTALGAHRWSDVSDDRRIEPVDRNDDETEE
jgi:hypothetical protein